MSLVEGVVCVKRWLWIEDMHSWLPGHFQVAGNGPFPMFPQVKDIKAELLQMWTALGPGIDSDVERIK
eukprot:5828212-Pyramimonas_sp.AAC.1